MHKIGGKSGLGNKSFEKDAEKMRVAINRTTTPTGTVDHGGLTGLSDDDHSQYVHISAARTIQAQHTFAPTSTQAPFVLGANAQGVLVSGLNANQWEGNLFDNYLNQAVRTGDSPTFANLNLNYDGSNYADLTVSAAGLLTISNTGSMYLSPTGDIYLNPSNNDVFPGTAYTVNLGSLSNKYLTLHAAELWVETLVAQNTVATIGGRIIVAPTTTLVVDLDDDVGSTQIEVKHNGVLAVGDFLVMQADGKLEWMEVFSYDGVGGTGYLYTVYRNRDGSGLNIWYQGDAIVNTGSASEGFIDIYSVSGITPQLPGYPSSTAGPTIVGNVRGIGGNWNSYNEHWAIGNLNGLYNGTTAYGVGIGSSSANHILTTVTNGIEFYSSTTRLAQLTSTTWTLGQTTSEHVEITTSAVNFKDGTTTYASLSGAVWVIGPTATENIQITSTAINFRDATTVKGSLSGTNWTLGESGGDNVYITASGVQVRESTTVRFDAATTYLKVGTDTSDATKTAFAIFNTNTTYNSESVSQYDILIGDNTTGLNAKANILWDHSAGSLKFRHGTTASITINSGGAMSFAYTGDADNYLKFTNSDITVYTSGYGWISMNKTDSQSNTYGILGMGYHLSSAEDSQIGFERQRVLFAIQTSSVWDYPLELLSNIVRVNDSVIEMGERTSTANPTASGIDARLFVDDNGSGKTRLRVIFKSGSAITLATEV